MSPVHAYLETVTPGRGARWWRHTPRRRHAVGV